jgi:hypothetical protein
MSRFASIFFIALLGVAALPAQAQARVVVGVGLGLGGWGYYPYYSPYYYGYPAYVAPPPTVVYEAPPAPVTYVQPQVVQTAPVVQPQAAQTAPANQVSPTSPTFADSSGRTCRNFQSTIDGAPVSGTACLQSDGTWRTVGP